MHYDNCKINRTNEIREEYNLKYIWKKAKLPGQMNAYAGIEIDATNFYVGGKISRRMRENIK